MITSKTNFYLIGNYIHYRMAKSYKLKKKNLKFYSLHKLLSHEIGQYAKQEIDVKIKKNELN